MLTKRSNALLPVINTNTNSLCSPSLFIFIVAVLEGKIVISKLGDNATLSCIYPGKELSLNNLRVYWQIDDVQEQCSVVHALISGQDNESEQCIHFKNRTQLLWDRLGEGDFSLLLLNVSQSDERKYKCVVLQTNEYTRVVHQEKVVLRLAGKNFYHLHVFTQSLTLFFPVSAISILYVNIPLS